jgi:hypothetical protein
MTNRKHIIVKGSDQPRPRVTPKLENEGRWHHIASEAELIAAIRDKEAVIYEIPWNGMTFVVSHKTLRMVRCSAMGADTRNIEGGWVYLSDLHLRIEEQELAIVSRIK